MEGNKASDTSKWLKLIPTAKLNYLETLFQQFYDNFEFICFFKK